MMNQHLTEDFFPPLSFRQSWQIKRGRRRLLSTWNTILSVMNSLRSLINFRNPGQTTPEEITAASLYISDSSIRSNWKVISTAATGHTAHTTSMSDQMVVHHENMKASVPDLYDLAYRGRRQKVGKVDLPISEPDASPLLVRLAQVWPLMSEIRRTESGQSFSQAEAGTHLNHTTAVINYEYSPNHILCLFCFYSFLLPILLSVGSSGVCRA